VENVKKVVIRYFYDDFMSTMAIDEQPAYKHWMAIEWARKRYNGLTFAQRYSIYLKYKNN
tara:strand:- start:363 stop:542 length:180 start_codon:yes stop_codon:yes gene_type:complete